MKNIVFLFALAFTFCLSEVKAQIWPYGNATALSPGVGGTTAITVSNNMNYVASIPTLTANLTLSVTASSQLKPGAVMLLTIKTTSLETVTFTGALAAPTVTGATLKTWSQAYIYNGTKFYPAGAKIQVD